MGESGTHPRLAETCNLTLFTAIILLHWHKKGVMLIYIFLKYKQVFNSDIFTALL